MRLIPWTLHSGSEHCRLSMSIGCPLKKNGSGRPIDIQANHGEKLTAFPGGNWFSDFQRQKASRCNWRTATNLLESFVEDLCY